MGPGQPRLAHLPGVEQNYEPGFAVRAWIRTADGREWIVYSTSQPRSWKLWQVGISPQGDFDQEPELLASGIGDLTVSGSASADGKLAYSTRDSEDAIYQIPIGERGQKLDPIFQLPLPRPGLTSLRPSPGTESGWPTIPTIPAIPTVSC